MKKIADWVRGLVALVVTFFVEVVVAAAVSIVSVVLYLGTVAEALTAIWAFLFAAWQLIVATPSSWPALSVGALGAAWLGLKAFKRFRAWRQSSLKTATA